MKILILVNSIFTYGGEQRIVVQLANYLAMNNHLLMYTHDSDNAKETSPYLLNENIQLKYTKDFLYAPKRPISLLEFLRRFIRKISAKCGRIFPAFINEFAYLPKSYKTQWENIIQKNNIDVVIGVGGYYSLILSSINPKISVIKIGWEHSSFEAYFETKGIWYWNIKKLFAISLHNLDLCVILNRDMERKCRQNFNAKTKVIVDAISFNSVQKSTLENKIIIAVGRLEYVKRFDLIIKAFSLFKKDIKNNEWKLWIIGDGNEFKALYELAIQLNIVNDVVFKGYTNDIKSYYLNASIFIMSSRWEGLSLVTLEAMECGLPVICSNIPVMHEIIDSNSGIIVENNNENDFANAINLLANNIELRKKLSIGAINRALNFHEDVIMAQWDSLLDQLYKNSTRKKKLDSNYSKNKKIIK